MKDSALLDIARRLEDKWTGELVAKVRADQAITRLDMASSVGTTERTIFRWERGENELGLLASRALTLWAIQSFERDYLESLLPAAVAAS